MIRARIFAALAASGLAGLGGCVEDRPGITGTQSLAVELVSPADPGAIDRRLADGLVSVRINVTAYDAAHEVDAGFDRAVEVYAQFLGTVTPTPTLSGLTGLVATPLATIQLHAGRATDAVVMLPTVLGPTTLWVEDGPKAIRGTFNVDPSDTPTYATGTSPVLWFRDPFIADLQRPPDETRIDALLNSPLQSKQVTVDSSRYGAAGRLVVTSVFSQGYTVSDVQCVGADAAPPCTAAAYDHILVFSFSAPRDQRGRLLRQGQVIDGFSGGLSDFNGLTEVGFPATFVRSDDVDVNPARLPAPAVVDAATWFRPVSVANGVINFERNEAAPIQINNGKVCKVDDIDNAYETFKQWKLDPAGVGGDCGRNDNVISLITAGVISDLDPHTLEGKTLPRVVGVLRPVQLNSFNVWIAYPRSAEDLTLP